MPERAVTQRVNRGGGVLSLGRVAKWAWVVYYSKTTRSNVIWDEFLPVIVELENFQPVFHTLDASENNGLTSLIINTM